MQPIQTRFVQLLTLLLTFLIPIISHANSIKLYEEPKDQAKVVGSIDLAAGIIPIFTPKNSDWIKVADPRNGNTGWVKSGDMKDSKGNVITFTQQFSQDNNKNSSTQFMQFGNKVMTPEQRKAAEQQLKSAQESLVKSIDNLNKVYEQEVEAMRQNGMVVRPLNIMPKQSNSNAPSVNLPVTVQQNTTTK